MNELDTLKRLEHPNIIQFLGKCTQNMLIVMEYMKIGSLSSLLSRELGQKLNIQQTLQIAKEIAKGMRYLESMKIVHGNLTTKSILVDIYDERMNSFLIKIADFECSYMLVNQNDSVEVSFKERKYFIFCSVFGKLLDR